MHIVQSCGHLSNGGAADSHGGLAHWQVVNCESGIPTVDIEMPVKRAASIFCAVADLYIVDFGDGRTGGTVQRRPS
jgi:hypothetical protein